MRESRVWFTALCVAIVAMLGATSGASAGSWGEYLDIENPHGEMTARYLDYSWYARQNNAESRIRYGLLEEELYLGTKIAVYDPRFLQIELGGGATVGQGYGDHDGGKNSLNKLNFSADILKLHPYSGNVRYNLQQIDFQQSPTATYLLNQEEYGASLNLDEGVLSLPLPVKIRFDTLRRDNKNAFMAPDITDSRLSFYALDEATATTELTSQKRWQGGTDLYLRIFNVNSARFYANDDQRSDFSYENNGAYMSASGGLGEKIGDNNAWRWRTIMNLQNQNAWPKFSVFETDDELRYMLFDNPTQALDSVVNVGFTDGEREGRGSNSGPAAQRYGATRLNGGFDHRLFQSLFSEAKLRYNELAYPDFTDTRQELLLGTRYVKQIPGGNIAAHYAVTGKQEVNTGAFSSSVYNEFYIVSDYNAVAFSADNIVTSSIVVTDQSGNITYIEGIDYRTYRIGRKTYLERLPGSTMPNGGMVLVSYSMLNYIGALKELAQDLALSVRWRFLEPYVRIRDVGQELQEGNALLLNPGRSTIYGLKINHTLWELFAIEIGLEEEENSYLIDPFHRSQIRGAVSMEILSGLNLGVYSSRSESDFNGEDHDMADDVLGANLNLNWGRLTATLGASREKHRIGYSTRDLDILTAGTTYKYGRWTFGSNVRLAEEAMENKDGASDYRFYDIGSRVIRFNLSRKF